jgi:hypothetical protein
MYKSEHVTLIKYYIYHFTHSLSVSALVRRLVQVGSNEVSLFLDTAGGLPVEALQCSGLKILNSKKCRREYD